MNLDIIHLGLLPHLGASELFLIAFIVLMLFGAKRLPEIAKGFGKAVREFRRSASDFEGDLRKSMEGEEAKEGAQAKAEVAATKGKEEESKEAAGTSA